MNFDYEQYRNLSFISPLIRGTIFGIILIVIVIKIIKIPSNNMKYTIANILSIVIFVLLIINSILQLRYGIYLLHDDKNQYITISGEIENIDKVLQSPRYYYNDKPVHASIVTINGEKLYFMTIGDLEKGDYIEVAYLSKSSFVLNVKLLKEI